MEKTDEKTGAGMPLRKEKNGKKIAVTGGIGSGKSMVCSILREKGYPVFSCDGIYREMQADPVYLGALEKIFPGVTAGGVLDRKKLSAVVFRDGAALAKLNALSHPAIMRRLYERMAAYPVAFAEVPLLFESGRQGDFDGVIVVYRPQRERIDAVRARDGLSEEEILLRMKNQADYEKIIREGHTVIYNDGDLSSLRHKVASAVEEILG